MGFFSAFFQKSRKEKRRRSLKLNALCEHGAQAGGPNDEGSLLPLLSILGFFVFGSLAGNKNPGRFHFFDLLTASSIRFGLLFLLPPRSPL